MSVRRWPGAAEGLIVGYALAAIVSIAGYEFRRGAQVDISVWLSRHSLELAQTLGIGVVHAVVVAFVRSQRVPTPAALLLAAGAAAPAIYAGLGTELWRQSCLLIGGRFERPVFVALLAFLSLSLPAIHVVGAFAARRPALRWLAVSVAVAALVANQVFAPDDHFGGHALVACAAATLAGTSLGLSVVRGMRRVHARPWVHRASRPARWLGGASALLALASLVAFPAPNIVRVELFRSPATPGAWVAAAFAWRAPAAPSPFAALAPPWPESWTGARANLPPRPPSPASIVAPGAAPVVVLITVDSLRADIFQSHENLKRLPQFSRMIARGAHFTSAVAPGSQTAVSLTSLFTGRYYSQLRFTAHGQGASRFMYAADDPAPRFPALLTTAGVDTRAYVSLAFLAESFGVVRGFREVQVVVQGRRHALAREVEAPLLAALRRAGSGPSFFYAHIMEPHFPYDRGELKTGSAFERYLSEVEVVDEVLARVDRLLQQRFAGRGVLIVSADHGEAFGEHGTTHHTKTLYEELLRVPLIVTAPRISPRTIDERVGLIDLGPTLLDVFGVETPAEMMGQSLVPLLAGGGQLERPLFAEGRLRRAVYGAGGVKVIEDLRRKTVEAYDLRADPHELRNIFHAADARVYSALAGMRAFFEANTPEGYAPPYKP